MKTENSLQYYPYVTGYRGMKSPTEKKDIVLITLMLHHD